jgi:hypothetical protein
VKDRRWVLRTRVSACLGLGVLIDLIQLVRPLRHIGIVESSLTGCLILKELPILKKLIFSLTPWLLLEIHGLKSVICVRRDG